MRTPLRNFFQCRHRLASILSYVRQTNRANPADSPVKTKEYALLG